MWKRGGYVIVPALQDMINYDSDTERNRPVSDLFVLSDYTEKHIPDTSEKI